MTDDLVGLDHIRGARPLIKRLEKLDRDYPNSEVRRTTVARLANSYRELEEFVLFCEAEVKIVLSLERSDDD